MKCLLCYKPLESNEIDYHVKCLQNTFGINQIPDIEINESDWKTYAKKALGEHIAITGVQPKLSLWLYENNDKIRFTIVGNKSNYIIKPQSEIYDSLPENEDLCMHLSESFGIETAKHGLIRLSSGSLAYITKRFDRIGEQKIALEDLCQLSETLTEQKYNGSYEKAGKTIRQYSTLATLDALKFFELIVFSFITGNADMHLKNFSMIEKLKNNFNLSPAYDLVSTALVIKNETEQMALNLNGRKNNLNKKDFDSLSQNLKLNIKQTQNVYYSFNSNLNDALWWIENSFVPRTQKDFLINLIKQRINILLE